MSAQPQKKIVLPEFKEATPQQATQAQKEYAPHLVAMSVGLRNYSQVGKVGDLIAILTQAKFDATGKTEPCLVIAAAQNPRERHVFIPLSQMWRMVEPRQNVLMARALCEKLYGFVTRFDAMRVVDALYEFAEDLKNAPPPREMTSQEFLQACADDGFVFTRNDEKVNG
jgi:hypothetical protein